MAMLAASVAGIAGGLIATMLFVRGITRRVRGVERNAIGLQDGLPRTPVPGRDEIGRLDATLDAVGSLLLERENDLRRSESFLDSIVDNIPNMVFAKDAAELRFVLFNRAGEELVGYR